jgi:mRNA-degrading endonuclease RelE of RelBE toxin-antitoxin system
VVVRLQFKRSVKKELLDLDDDTFVRVIRTILELQENPRPRGCDVVAGKSDQLRVWAGRDFRVLYEVDETKQSVVIIAIRKKDEGTYR